MARQFIRQQLAVLSITSAVLLTLMSGCSSNESHKPESGKEKEGKSGEVAELDYGDLSKLDVEITRAESLIAPLGDNKIKGKVTFQKVEGGVKIVADIDGLTPGEHGFHVHEFGECSKDGASAGAHYNPTHSRHGAPDSAERHIGDLGNLIADANGYAHYERVDKLLKLQGRSSILGRSIIIHADKDDYVTQPAGASGQRIACGTIQPIID